MVNFLYHNFRILEWVFLLFCETVFCIFVICIFCSIYSCYCKLFSCTVNHSGVDNWPWHCLNTYVSLTVIYTFLLLSCYVRFWWLILFLLSQKRNKSNYVLLLLTWLYWNLFNLLHEWSCYVYTPCTPRNHRTHLETYLWKFMTRICLKFRIYDIMLLKLYFINWLNLYSI